MSEMSAAGPGKRIVWAAGQDHFGEFLAVSVVSHDGRTDEIAPALRAARRVGAVAKRAVLDEGLLAEGGLERVDDGLVGGAWPSNASASPHGPHRARLSLRARAGGAGSGRRLRGY